MFEIVFSILMVGGVGIIIYGFFQLWLSNRSKSWPYVMGVVLEKTVEKKICSSRDQQGNRYSYTEYVPVVEYRYTTESGEHISNRIYVGWNPNYDTKKEATEVIAPFSKGKETKVYYNPKDDSYSIIAHTGNLKEKAIIFFGFLFTTMAGGIGALIYFLEN